MYLTHEPGRVSLAHITSYLLKKKRGEGGNSHEIRAPRCLSLSLFVQLKIKKMGEGTPGSLRVPNMLRGYTSFSSWKHSSETSKPISERHRIAKASDTGRRGERGRERKKDGQRSGVRALTLESTTTLSCTGLDWRAAAASSSSLSAVAGHRGGSLSYVWRGGLFVSRTA